jgi:hypothetical protein
LLVQAQKLAEKLESAKSTILDAEDAIQIVDPSERHDKCKALEEDKRRIIKELPEPVRYYFDMRIPYWSILDLQEEASSLERMGKLEQQQNILKEQLKLILNSAMSAYPASEIGRLFSEAEVELDEELKAIYISHIEASNEEWARAKQTIASSLTSELLNAMDNAIQQGMVAWLEQSQNHILYSQDIRRLQEAMKLVNPEQYPDIQRKLKLVDKVIQTPNDISVLRDCLYQLLEPFSDGPGWPVLVEHLISVEKLKEFKMQLDAVRVEADKVGKTNEDVQKMIEDLKIRVDNISNKNNLLNELTEKVRETTSLHSKLQKATEDAEKTQDEVTEKIVRAYKSIGVLENQVNAAQDVLKQTNSILAYDQQAAVLTFMSAMEHVWKGNFAEAKQVLDSYLQQQDQFVDQGDLAVTMLDRWKQNLAGVLESNEKQNSYQHWIKAIKENDKTTSLDCLIELKTDQYTQPLYEYLYNRHTMLWEQNIDFLVKEWRDWFENGQFEQLEKALNLAPQSDMGVELLNEWRYRLQLATFLAQFLNNRRRDKNIEALLRQLLPKEIWIAAKQNSRKNKKPTGLQSLWQKVTSLLGVNDNENK